MTFWEIYWDVTKAVWFWGSYLLVCGIIGYFVLGCVTWLASVLYKLWMGRGGDDN